MKYIALCLLALSACGKSEKNIRAAVMQLTSPVGLCSGEQVKAASGTQYILTAGHCLPLEVDGSITVTTADGRTLERRIIAEDHESDLLLLEGVPNIEGLSVAKSSKLEDIIRTFTHGNKFATYSTSGVLIDYADALVPVEDDLCELGYTKYQKKKVPTFFGIEVEVCAMVTKDIVTNALIVPGSSGGPIVSERGELVGVVSAGDGTFGYMVSTSDIRNFLRSY